MSEQCAEAELREFLQKGIGPGPRQSAHQLAPRLPKRSRYRWSQKLVIWAVAASLLFTLMLSFFSATLAQALASLPSIGWMYYNVVSGLGQSYELGFINQLDYVEESQGARITVTGCYTDKTSLTVLLSIERLDGDPLDDRGLKFIRGSEWISPTASAPGPNNGRSYKLTGEALPWWRRGRLKLDMYSTNPELPGKWTLMLPVQRVKSDPVELVKLSDETTSGDYAVTASELFLAPRHTTLRFSISPGAMKTRWTMKTAETQFTAEGSSWVVMFPIPITEEAAFRLESVTVPIGVGMPLTPGTYGEGVLAITLLEVEVGEEKTVVRYRREASTKDLPFLGASIEVQAPNWPTLRIQARRRGEGVLEFPIDIRRKEATLWIAYELEVPCANEFVIRR